MRPQPGLVLLALVAGAAPVAAKHRQSPPVTALTTAGDTSLPRVPAPGKILALALPSGSGAEILRVKPFGHDDAPAVLAAAGANANPAISRKGDVVAWDTAEDPLGSSLPGRQVVIDDRGILVQAALDPTGTSANPALDGLGFVVAFESTGDLAGTGNAGARQVFLRNGSSPLVQASRGLGTSRHPALSAKGGLLAFESTSDPITGADTGVSQIWLGDIVEGVYAPITAGLGPSRNAAASNDGRLIAFESTADLAGSGADTGVGQVFAYHPASGTYAQVTAEAGGCGLPAVRRVKRDWRIAFVCGGEAFYHMLRVDQRYRVQTDAGSDTQRILPELGNHFVVLSTTADLLAGGTTGGHRVYLVNLFKRPAEPVPGSVTWFPFQGVSPL